MTRGIGEELGSVEKLRTYSLREASTRRDCRKKSTLTPILLRQYRGRTKARGDAGRQGFFVMG